MSIANCALERDRAVLAVDTGALTPTGIAVHVTKLSLLTGCCLALAVRGHLTFFSTLAGTFHSIVADWDTCEADFGAALAECFRLFRSGELAAGRPERYQLGTVAHSINEQQVVVVGWSARRASMTARVYEQQDRREGFTFGEMTPGQFFVAPWDATLGDAPCGPSSEAMFQTAALQAGLLERESPETPAAGDLVIAELSRDRAEIRRRPMPAPCALPDPRVSLLIGR